MSSFNNFFKDRSGELALTQKPNWPIITAGSAWLIAYLFKGGDGYTLFRLIFFAFLGYWSYLEVFKGDSGFRRLLGIVVSIYIITSIIGMTS